MYIYMYHSISLPSCVQLYIMQRMLNYSVCHDPSLFLTSGSFCPTSDRPTTATSATTHTDGPTDDGSSSPPTHDTPSPPTHDTPSPSTHNTPSPPTHNTPSGGTSSPTSEPSFQSACSAMNAIATKLKNSEFIDEDITCELNGCGDLNCTSQDTDLRIILHCSPMAVEIQYTDKESSESEIKTFTKSGTLAGGVLCIFCVYTCMSLACNLMQLCLFFISLRLPPSLVFLA